MVMTGQEKSSPATLHGLQESDITPVYIASPTADPGRCLKGRESRSGFVMLD